ncbi:MAG: di-heme oxidoredictase family protein [Verrucomicrobiota bacterium]
MNAKLVASALFGLAVCGCLMPEPAELGQPLAGLTADERARFEAGREVFERIFKPEDGLGPLFNSVSCAECHEDPALGGVGDEVEIHAARFTAPDSCDALFQLGGPVIQQDATPLLRAAGIDREQIPAGATQARRSTPPLFGLGLVDAIPEATILANEDPNDANGDGIAGRANRTIDGRVGRFGRKAVVAALFDFNAGAFTLEMGVTSPRSPVEETVNGKPVPSGTDPAPDPEITSADLEKADAFVRFLAPPPPKVFAFTEERELVYRGKKLFTTLKCAVCHVPEMTTGPHSSRALDRKRVALYSDLLLHDMGPALADICLVQAKPSEFRTEMLMGLRFRQQFLHDGSARTVTEAIERHGGEAADSRDRFKALGDDDKKALLKFLESI